MGVNLPPAPVAATEERRRGDGDGDLPPFARAGQQIDVTVSSIGNAKSLRAARWS